MTLKEKILSDNYLEDYDTPITDYQAGIIVQRADDYAIEFGMFLRTKCLIDDNYIYWWYYGIKYTEKQLLEIFKKEKGL